MDGPHGGRGAAAAGRRRAGADGVGDHTGALGRAPVLAREGGREGKSARLRWTDPTRAEERLRRAGEDGGGDSEGDGDYDDDDDGVMIG